MLLQLFLNLLLSHHSLLIFSHLNLFLLLLRRKEVLLEVLFKNLCLPVIRFSKSRLVPFVLNIVSIHIFAQFAYLVLG